MALARFLDYAANPQPSRSPFLRLTLAAAAFAVSFLNMNLTMCMCGYQDWTSLPGNLLGLALAFWAFYLPSRGLLVRAVAAFALIVCTLIFVFNVHNLLWSGHEPIFH